MIVFKILLGSEVVTLIGSGLFEGNLADLKAGFIHLSSANQLDHVVQKHYTGADDVYLVAVDADTLGKGIRWEGATNGQVYPHLYDALNIRSVISCSPLKRDEDGTLIVFDHLFNREL
jgi:uncharacterized protein (DUF952 family)